MPSKSPEQRRLMAAAAHDPAFAKKAGVPQSVAKDFNAADMHRSMMEEDKATRRGKSEKAMYGPSSDHKRKDTPVGRKGLLKG